MPSLISKEVNRIDLPATSARAGALRVLHLEMGRSYGGIQRMLVCLAENHEPSAPLEQVFALCFQEQVAQELMSRGAMARDLEPARFRSPASIWRANRRLQALLAEEPFDAVICHGSPVLAMFGFTVRRSGVPFVYWMHNDVKVRNKNVAEFVASRQQPDLVIANSEFTAASLPLHFARTPRHVVIPCPVTSLTRSAITHDERQRIRAEFDVLPHVVVIALAGRPERWKGHALLLEALGHLQSVPDWQCWIIGGAFDAGQQAFLEELRGSAREKGIGQRVRFLGQRSDLPELLAAADLFCHPNLTPEPFGIVFIEALYAGLPVVSVDHGGAREIVDDTCGRLVPPNDPMELAAALRDLVADADKRAALAQNAPARGMAISDPGRVLPRVYRELNLLKKTYGS
jgi:glycosyltransferase involved in cell wall biosynthesis